jgi:hypothetical protein
MPEAAGEATRRAVRSWVAARRAEFAGLSPAGIAAALVAGARAGGLGALEHVLGYAYEAAHDEDRRLVFARARRDGRKIDADGVVAASRIYTPRHIVDFLLQNSLGAMWLEMHPGSRMGERWPLLLPGALRAGRAKRPLSELRVLDPCCGCGAFLVAAADMLDELYDDERRLAAAGEVPADWTVAPRHTGVMIVERNLHAADLDPGAVEILARLLRSRAGRPARLNLAALAPPLGSLNPAVWEGERFDVVATNPPYVGFRLLDPAVKEAVRAADPLAGSDLAVAFQSRCFTLLREGGLCATVTPAAWLTGREALGLREQMLALGGPRLAAALGQRVFDQAPLLFVGLSVIERGGRPPRIHTIRVTSGTRAGGMRMAVASGARAVERELVTRMPLRPFLPAAPAGVLALSGRGPRLGDLFTSFDGVWTGSNVRDTRCWWDLPAGDAGWRALSGGQGHEPWFAPTRLRIRAGHAAGQPDRDGAVEYARVAGGRLAARRAASGTASLAGIVTLVPRDADGAERIEEVLAIFNSRIGTAWLRTLTSGLNFNPGYAAEIPLGRSAPPPELRAAVRELVSLRAAEAARDPTHDGFADTLAPWADDPLAGAVPALERAVEEMLADHLGLARTELQQLEHARRRPRRIDPLDDHLLVRVLRILGFGWPADAGTPAARRAWRADRLAQALMDTLEDEGAPEGLVDPGDWIARRLIVAHDRRFRRSPVIRRLDGAFALETTGAAQRERSVTRSRATG